MIFPLLLSFHLYNMKWTWQLTPPQEILYGTSEVDKAALGTKRVCPSCSARFYDLCKLPIVCPKCGHTFDPETMFKGRRVRDDEEKDKAAKRAKKILDEEEVTDVSDEDETDDEELDAGAEEDAAPEEPVHHDDSVDADDVTIEGIEDEDTDDDDDDDSLLEPDDDDDDDVSGIIDADIEKDEG